jgi:uncharacterized protein (DUF362 family)/NAD-dependent dihydropyrimidine dehydrogenase PreA subunit
MKTTVSIVRCRSYNPGEVGSSVLRAFELLGGISSFVKKGEKVLVKPNMLSGRPPEDGVNTHIELIRAVVRLVKECGGIPLIGDNPGGSMSPADVYKSSGFFSLAKEEGIQLKEAKDVKMVRGIPIASYFFECDKIISLPKMKTHSLMCLTGALKNMYGAVTGLNKSQRHKQFPLPEEFSSVLIDVFEAVMPCLVLMDGIIAMDGDGPAAGTLKDVGLLIAGEDSVAIDSVFSYLIGMNPLDILTTKEASRRGLGQVALEDIEIKGESIRECFIKGFRLPRSKKILNLPQSVVKILAGFVRFGPYINERACKRCRICQETCPVSAITINEKISRIDRRRCIRCMCCHEVCPYNAIGLKRSIPARAFGL